MAPLVPMPYRIVSRHDETPDVTTIALEPEGMALPSFLPGQFNMLTAFGVGEAAISVSSEPGGRGPVEHTIRDVGPVTHALVSAPVGSLVGVRGPFGVDWGLDDRAPHALVLAGGIGLAPLRGTVRRLLADGGARRTRLTILVGARSPEQIVFRDELEQWQRQGARVAVTVDIGTPGWTGSVGVVTDLLGAVRFDPARTAALVCGPEVMMRFAARALVDAGVAAERIRVALERNMQCGLGWCGHCQLGPLLLCRDGPVLPYVTVARLLRERER